MDPTFWKKVTQMIAGTRSTELGCADCYAKLDRFAELMREGKPADEIMPLVQDHLDRCDSCREEYEALLEALRETE